MAERRQQATESAAEDIGVYKRRWIMLFLFVATSASNAVHWTNYAIIANITMDYYQVSAMTVNMTCVIYMFMYITLIVPATFIMEKKGLRFSLILSVSMMCCGAWMKLFALDRNHFYVVFLAQAIIGASQIFILSVPPRLSSIWFDAKHLSTACAIGVFGNQLGDAFGFVVPPEIVRESDDLNQIRSDFKILYVSYAVPPTIILILILIFFEKEPKRPPSFARLQSEFLCIEKKNPLKELSVNRDFILLVICYSIGIGVFYAYSALLNQLYLTHYPEGEVDAGFVGFTLIVGGMFGSIMLGIFLDKTHLFKSTTILVYVFTFVGMLGFTLFLYYELYIFIYISSGFLGFFMTGFLTVAFEFVTEITYPISESTSSGILIAGGECSGLFMVIYSGEFFEFYGDLVANTGLTIFLFIGMVISFFIKGKKLRRYSTNIHRESDQGTK